MIDLETLGIDPATAPIIQIAAVGFRLDADGPEDRAFQTNVNAGSCLRHPFHRHIDPGTVAWWASTNPALLVEIMNGKGPDLGAALQDLSLFLQDIEIEGVWAKGPTFDITMLEEAYKQADMRVPWNFRMVRDVRTMEMIAGEHAEVWDGGTVTGREKAGKAHDALVDCLRQLRVVQQTWQKRIKHGSFHGAVA